jgi:antitoxin CptB
MTGSTRSSDGLDARRRRLLFRAWHRGIREMDLIMGRFSDAHIADLADNELDNFERLMELRDQEILSWIDGTAEVPRDYDTPLFRRLRDFNHQVER